MEKKTVTHYSNYASQPNVLLLCGIWTTPSWKSKPQDLPDGVYIEDENEDRYTFSRKDLVDCPICVRLMSSNYTHE